MEGASYSKTKWYIDNNDDNKRKCKEGFSSHHSYTNYGCRGTGRCGCSGYSTNGDNDNLNGDNRKKNYQVQHSKNTFYSSIFNPTFDNLHHQQQNKQCFWDRIKMAFGQK